MTRVPAVVLVTGASRGIGRATAVAFARDGARVVLAARGSAGLEESARECREAGAAATLPVRVDVADRAAVDDLFAAAVRAFGPVDVVVHAAAVMAYGRLTEMPAAVFDQVTAVNLTGTANVARAALRHFAERETGRLVLVGSRLGELTLPTIGPYVASKWAVHGLARVLQQETRRMSGVEVSLVAPQSVNTPIYRSAATYTGRRARPIPPVVEPDRVARAIVRTVRHPRRTRHIGLAGGAGVLLHRRLPGVADALAGPVVRIAAQSRQARPPAPGNVFAAAEEKATTQGEWPARGRRTAIGAGALATLALVRALVRSRRP